MERGIKIIEEFHRGGGNEGPREWVEFCCSPEWIAVTIQQQHQQNKEWIHGGAQSPITWDAVEGGASFCQIEVNKRELGLLDSFLSSKTMNFNNPFPFPSSFEVIIITRMPSNPLKFGGFPEWIPPFLCCVFPEKGWFRIPCQNPSIQLKPIQINPIWIQKEGNNPKINIQIIWKKGELNLIVVN